MGKTEKPLPPEVEEDIKLRFKDGESILKDTDSVEAITRLFWLGCDPVRILLLLEAYCEVDPKNGRRRTDDEHQPDELDLHVRTLSRRLKRDAEALERPGVPAISPGLAGQMKKVSEHLSDVYKSWLEPDLPRGAKVAFLVAAVETVQMKTSRPHYPEIAELVHFLRSKADPTSTSTDATTLRLNVRNFKDRGEMPFLTRQEIRAEVGWGCRKWDPLRRRLQKR